MRNFLLACVLLFSLAAQAAAPITGWKAQQANGDQLSPVYPSSSAACNALAAATNKALVLVSVGTDSSRWLCQGGGYSGSVLASVPICSDGGQPNTSKPLAQQCSDPAPTCTAGAVSTHTYYKGWAASPTSPIIGGPTSLPSSDGTCGFKPTGVVSCDAYEPKTHSTGADIFCTYTGENTGVPAPANDPYVPASSVPTTPSTPTSDVENVPKGQGCPAGTMNVGTDSSGTSICVGKGTDPGTPTKTTNTNTSTTTNADGSKTTTTTTTSKNSDGSTTTTTTTNTVKGDGSSSGSTTKSTGKTPSGENGEDDGEDDAPADHVTPVAGDLYTKGSRTFGNVFNDFSSTVGNAPVIASAKNFFNVSVSGAGCPNWSASVPYFNISINLSQYFCGGAVAAMLSVMGIGVMIAAAYTAFRIGFL